MRMPMVLLLWPTTLFQRLPQQLLDLLVQTVQLVVDQRRRASSVGEE